MGLSCILGWSLGLSISVWIMCPNDNPSRYLFLKFSVLVFVASWIIPCPFSPTPTAAFYASKMAVVPYPRCVFNAQVPGK